jgi:hypothetical protein
LEAFSGKTIVGRVGNTSQDDGSRVKAWQHPGKQIGFLDTF